jgi:3-hydroxybutyryl-CoA dehydrogenase
MIDNIFPEDYMEIKTVGVLGCGLMGSGIAHVSAAAGYETIVREVDDGLLQKGLGKLYGFIDKSIARKKMSEFEKRQVSTHLRGTTDLSELKNCDLVIEAITENLELKNEQWKELDGMCGADTIFATNTSSLKVRDQAAATNRPDRFVGMHFFNPVPVMKLVEVVRTDQTGDEAFKAALSWVKSIDKVGVACIDTTGFVVNRLLVPYLLDGIRAYEAGIATVTDIDNAMMLGCGYPMGPLTLLDFVGLDTTHYIAGIMTDEFDMPQYHSPKLLQTMVDKGLMGKKSGKGFYDYSTGAPVPNDDELKGLL